MVPARRGMRPEWAYWGTFLGYGEDAVAGQNFGQGRPASALSVVGDSFGSARGAFAG